MPGWRVHRYLDVVFFGKSYSKIHRKMDDPCIFLGRRHRVLFHDPAAAVVIAQECYPGDPDAVEAAYLHILTDEFCTGDPYYKKDLEILALLNRPKKRTSRKRRKREPQDPIMRKFRSDARKLAEIQRLYNVFRSRRR
jgi:hypothetical protein